MESGKRKLLSNPRKASSLISVLFFGWTIPIFKKSYTKLLHINDAFEPLNEDRSKVLGDRLERSWKDEIECNKPRLMRAVFKAFWIEILKLGALGVLTDSIINLSVAIALGSFLTYFQENSDISRDDAFKYGICIFILTMGGGMGFLHYFYNGAYYAMKVRVALSSLIYRKILRLSQKSLSQTATGKLVNLLSNDVNRFDSLVCLHSLWISPITTIAATYILWREIQWAGIIGVAIILVFTPAQSYAGKLSAVFRFKTALRTDERARFMDEIISGVQVIKMYAWEKPFQRLIAVTRKLELDTILKNSYVRSFYMTIALFTTRFALFCSLLSFVLLYGSDNITVPKMFMMSYLFGFISVLMGRMFIRGISEMGEAYMAIKRLQMFLEYEERNEKFENNSEQLTTEEMQSRDLAIFMKNTTAEWAEVNGKDSIKTARKVKNYKNTSENISNDSEEKDIKSFRLQDISLEVRKGQLIFVIGSIGSGKSTLLQTLLRELPLIGGSMTVNGSISYASQESWIFTSNIRQNITFSQPIDPSRYDEVVKCTALIKDFTQFSDGDMTLIGEHGAGLSGGQKARINLARAVYRKASVYLIDDPLSAVDANVQLHLFQKCLGPKGFLAQENATRVLVTHQLQFLKEADWIIVLKEGKVETQGDYNTVIKSGVDFTRILGNNEKNEVNNCTEIEGNANYDGMKVNSMESSLISSIAENEKIGLEDNQNSSKDSSKEEIGLLKELESSSKGKVKEPLLFHYFKSANQPCTLVFIIVSFLLAQIFASVSDVWVSFWIKKEENRHQYLYSNVYNKTYKYENSSNNEIDSITHSEINLWSTQTFVYIYSGIMIFLLVITAARSAIYSKFCATSSQNLHDTMFRGLIYAPMKFFDDNPVGRIMNRFTKDLGSVDEALSKVILDAFQNNLNVIGAIIITIGTDPKLSIVIVLMGGLFILIRKIYLRSSKNTKRLEGMTKSPVFTHISATLSGLSTIRAFQAESILQDEFEEHQDVNTGVWFMFIGVSNGFGMSLDMMAYIYVAFVLYFFLAVNEDATGDKIGLAITQSLFLTATLQYGVRYSADVENHLMSFERILEYCQLKPEKQPEIPQNVPEDWPSNGKVEFKNVSYRYSAESEPVLRGLTFTVEPKEKISVVGRTGAGKSSLINSIFRLAIVDGDILLDNVKTSCIELSVLRSRVSIIPQEPILFSGTLRRNLDPFEEYSDDDIWNALENVELKELVKKINCGLAMPVLARGQNFSTGQRQILCLARAILRRNKIIILDEATANVDLQTDAMIQRTIKEKFADCTVITVAHRLNTVIDSDRVLVIDAGVAVEFDAPYILMQKMDGIFKNLTEALGPQEYERLYSKAKETFETARAKN